MARFVARRRHGETMSSTHEDILALFDPQEGVWDDVIGRHFEYLRFYPTSPVVYYNLGFSFAERDQAKNAEAAFRKALEFKPDMVEAWINLGGLAYGRADWAECIRCNEKALAIDAGFPAARLNIGFARLMLDETAEALKLFEAIIEENPELGPAHYGLAVAHYSLDNLEAARKHYAIAVSRGVEPELEFSKKLTTTHAPEVGAKS